MDSIIAIDGPAGSGKSTVARSVAEKLSYIYIDTGAMYRALTLKAVRKNIDLKNKEALVELAHNTTVDIVNDKKAGLKVLLDGEDVVHLIRTPELTEKVSCIARIEDVRKEMVVLQRKIGEKGKCVFEGRDITTVVFPCAKYKFYLDANLQERAKRRHKELIKDQTLESRIPGKGLTLEEVEKDINSRDSKDKNRSCGPLRKADDAIYIDTSDLTIKEMVDKVCSYIH